MLTDAIRSGHNQFYGFAGKLTDEQFDYIEACETKNIVFCNARAGTGKTTVAVAMADYLHKTFPKAYYGAYYVFATVEEDKLGFSPGDIFTKENKYTAPLIDALKEIGQDPKQAIITPDTDRRFGNAWIQPASHNFLRGTNLMKSIVIIDEAQNFTRAELKKTLTRIHDNCLVIVIGHAGQCDLKNKKKSGFVPYLEHYRVDERCGIVSLTYDFRGWIARHADALSEDDDG